MKKEKCYKYIGRNGSITSSILLEKIDPIPMFCLKADDGKVLLNEDTGAMVDAIRVFADEIDSWIEIVDIRKKDNPNEEE